MIEILIVLVFCFVMSDFEIYVNQKNLYVDNKGLIYRKAGKNPGRWRNTNYVSFVRLKRINYFLFREKELVGAKVIGSDVFPMTEEQFDNGYGE